jgi:hypothetical protein
MQGSQTIPRMGRLFFVAGAGLILFAIGVILLHLNPYWRNDPDLPMVIDKRVHLWSGVGHLVCAVGIVGGLGGAAFILLSAVAPRHRARWSYWAFVVLCGSAFSAWLAVCGTYVQYNATFHWDSVHGITSFGVDMEEGRHFWESWRDTSPNPLWQAMVRWQVEPDLDGYLRIGKRLRRTDGDISINVVRIIPIAVPTALGSDGEILHNVESY